MVSRFVLNFCNAAAQKVFADIDKSGDGRVSFTEFCNHMREVLDREARVDDAEKELCERLHRMLSNRFGANWLDAVRTEFRKMDTNATGKLSSGEMRKALEKWGVSLTPKDAKVRKRGVTNNKSGHQHAHKHSHGHALPAACRCCLLALTMTRMVW